ncbi:MULTISPECIES: NAD-dependent epimerase/dehydratase family protein [unclassified Paenibacillus]|uniref:NAD-dependent epimerase/dehydratase family protein n=1 Tax=unclassified Paenibacillus TaxID=185978 RepID=UPI001AE28D49|nr:MULTISPECIES: NAD-dependent epimerase/dehydratase family protein [unclassified Paenibacillus]MBP1156938.1 nucleoside-diphosphate-sugar epimerase [Paenibacillus sp. PvP091]MBP1172323.1 nucleoside-diphosphate-sugar epimerase [Paenibacillus sp. PvR098]MBP2438704.1 nucleoside-diphosphate-sugar epimerase [Paenibacillus sp. PvP052]
MKKGMHVIFGAGPLGRAVMEELVHQGCSVRMVHRSGTAEVPPEVELVPGDASEADQVMRISKDADVVYNCTGLPYPMWNHLPQIMNGLIDGVSRTNAILVYGDNLYAYGPVEGKVSESSPYHPVGRKTAVRAQAANMLMNAHRQGKIRAAIGRGPSFYGPGVTLSVLGSGIFDNLIANQPMDALGNIDAPHSLIYIKDFARGLVTLGAMDKALGEIWHVPCDRTTNVRELTQMIATQLEKMPRYRIANKFILTLLSMFNPTMREFQEIFYQYQRPFIMDDSKFRNAFDFKVTSHDEAIRMTLFWYMKGKKPVEF